MTSHLTIEAPAKTNLFLLVGERDASGYHDVTTVLCPLGLCDTLRVVPRADSTSNLVIEGDFETGDPENNLIIKALKAMQQAFSRTEEFDITLEKKIPVGAGLGGGSSDAAATIAALAHLWGIPLSDERIQTVARSLGADVPFFLYGGATLMTGRGDTLVRTFEMPSIPALIVKPPQSILTAEAYATFDRLQEATPVNPHREAAIVAILMDLLRALDEHDPVRIASSTYNNLSQAALNLVPFLSEVLTLAEDDPSVYTTFISGSGSAVVILCEDVKNAEQLSLRAAEIGCESFLTTTRDAGARIIREDSGE